MVSILEELGNSAASDDLFDVEQFTEMMEAYLPGFQAVDRSAMLQLCTAYMSGTSIRECSALILPSANSPLPGQEQQSFHRPVSK